MKPRPGPQPAEHPLFSCRLPSPPRCPQSHSAVTHLRVGARVGAVLFGGKQRPFWRDQGLSTQLSSRSFWNWEWGEVFAAQGTPVPQPRLFPKSPW